MRIAIACVLIALLAGCKVVIDVPANGHVSSESGAYSCSKNSTCTLYVYDTHFSDTFTAVPNEGYKFIGWKKRSNGFCGGKTTPCRLTTKGFEEHPELMGILESDEEFFLQPVFESTTPPPEPQDIAELTVIETGAPLVRDSRNRVIGTLQAEISSGFLVNVNFIGLPNTYTLKVQRWSAPELAGGFRWVAGEMALLFSLPNCSNKSTVYAAFAGLQVGGAQNGVYYIQHPDATPGYIPEDTVRSEYWAPEPTCRSSRGGNEVPNYTRMLRTNLKIRLPLSY